jgi:radical SAM protein with 4Fe4S-binding SPASM domain
MNERFKVSDKDLVYWDPGMEKVLEEYIRDTLDAPATLPQKIKSLFTLDTSITLACLYDSILNKRIMPCFAGSQIVHVDPIGNVYPCNFKLTTDRILGNLRDRSFDEIWESVPADILKEIKCGDCMYPNGLCGDSDIYPSVCNSFPFVFRWYLKKILKKEDLIHTEDNGG